MKEILLLMSCILGVIVCFIWLDRSDFKQFENLKLFHWIQDHSFTAISKKLEKLNVRYTLTEYTTTSVFVGGILFTLVYNTIHNWFYTLLLLGVVLFFLPYLNYINCMRKYEEKIERDCYDFTCTAITYLRENRSVFRVLRDCQKIVEDPLKSDLEQVLIQTHNGVDLQESLLKFSTKYPYDEILKLNQLLLSKAKDGVYSPVQYDVMMEHLEDLEKVVINFRIQKDSKRKGFYMVIAFSLISGYLVQSLFNADMMMDMNRMKFYYFIFFSLHVALILLFERKFSRTTKSKERRTL
ncbi:MAG: hypothetical protein RR700_06355 [Anaerorhabdus sp.]|uniref:hypothetical protein n=1 Tax=Anaerorhabdus sp. TaxID=1872524 RepID=UPI002FC89E92